MSLNEPQIWALIGVFAAAMFGTLGLIIPLISRTIKASTDSIAAKVDALDAKMEVRLDALDRDVSALMKRQFGIPD